MAKRKAIEDILRPHVADIKADADAGNATAKRIINLYRLDREEPTKLSREMCEAVLADWLKERS
jgi:hypothetical protein